MLSLLASNLSPAGAMSLFFGGIALMSLIGIAAYVYFALVWSSIAKKLGYEKHWLAWIPIANMFLYPILAGKKWGNGFWLLLPVVNVILMIIWSWKIFEKRKYSGWWNLLLIASPIPVVGWIAGLGYAVVLGFVAWK